jgi:hypothetical protein
MTCSTISSFIAYFREELTRRIAGAGTGRGNGSAVACPRLPKAYDLYTVMPLIPTAVSASVTASRFIGLMMAVTIFIVAQ